MFLSLLFIQARTFHLMPWQLHFLKNPMMRDFIKSLLEIRADYNNRVILNDLLVFPSREFHCVWRPLILSFIMPSINLPSGDIRITGLEIFLKNCVTFITLPSSGMSEILRERLHTTINNSTISSFNSVKTLEWVSYSPSDFLVFILSLYWITSSTVSSVSDDPLLSPLNRFGAPPKSSYSEHQSKTLIYHLRHSLVLAELSLNNPVISWLAELACFLLLCWEKDLDLPCCTAKHVAYRTHASAIKMWSLGQGRQEEKDGLKLRQWNNGLESWIYVTAICTRSDLFKSSVCTICSLLIFWVTGLIPLVYK